jgi:hypothetical protein
MKRSLFSTMFGLLMIPSSVQAYDAYPPGGSYVTGTAAQYPWVGENFDSYAHNAIVETSANKALRSHLDVTSGVLEAKHVSSYKRGWTTTYNFRTVAIGTSGSSKVKWTDQTNQYRGYIQAWQNGDPNWSGLHAFARYQTDDNLYVASIRYDGLTTIKRKLAGAYTTLAQTSLPNSYLDSNGNLKTGQWFTLKFSVFGNQLKFSLDGTQLLTATDSNLTFGTIGIRTDYANIYFDDWKLLSTNPEPSSALLMLTAMGLLGAGRRRR